MNIAISIILVPRLGLTGVAIGTLIAMTFRTWYQIWYLRDHLINRPFKKFLRRFAAFALPTAAGIFLCIWLWPTTEYTIASWLIHAVIYCIVFAVIYACVSYFCFRNDLKTLKAYIKHRH